jgi:hypothetical protein
MIQCTAAMGRGSKGVSRPNRLHGCGCAAPQATARPIDFQAAVPYVGWRGKCGGSGGYLATASIPGELPLPVARP